jgi:hypothetical protein
MLDLGDLPIHDLEPERDDERPAALLHQAVEADLTRRDIDRVDARPGRSFRGGDPKALGSDTEPRGVLGELDVAVERQAGRIVRDQRI